MSTAGKRKLRETLYAKDPICPKCKVKMILPSELPRDGQGRTKVFPDNACTLNRRWSRYYGYERSQNRKPATIMCKRCSDELSDLEQEGISIEERTMRSHRTH